LRKQKSEYQIVHSLPRYIKLKIPKDWDFLEISHVCNTMSGGTPSTTNPEYYDGDIPWLTTSELKNNFVTETKYHITKDGLKNSSAKKIPPNSTIVAMYGATIGKTCINIIEMTTNQACCIFTPKKENSVVPYFLQQILIYFRPLIVSLAEGSGQPNISQDFLKKFKIPFPATYHEQQKIASILYNVDELIQKQQEVITQTQKLKKGQMQKLLLQGIGHSQFKKVKWYFGTQIEIPKDWEVRTLGSLVTLLTNGFVGKATVHYTESENSVLYVQGYNIKENNFNFHGIKRVSQEFDEQNKKSRLQSGDLLTIQTGNIGTTAIVPDELIGANCHALIISRLKREIADPEFYSQYFNSYHCQRMFKMIEIGTSLKHLNGSDMKKLQFLRPPLPEQQKIASILSNLDLLIQQEKQYKEKLENPKKGLMQQLLTGEKRVQV